MGRAIVPRSCRGGKFGAMGTAPSVPFHRVSVALDEPALDDVARRTDEALGECGVQLQPRDRSRDRSRFRGASSTSSRSFGGSSCGLGRKAQSPSSCRRWEVTAARPPRASARCSPRTGWTRRARLPDPLGHGRHRAAAEVGPATGRVRRRGITGVGDDRRQPGQAPHRLPRALRERADEDGRHRPGQPGAGRAHPRPRHVGPAGADAGVATQVLATATSCSASHRGERARADDGGRGGARSRHHRGRSRAARPGPSAPAAASGRRPRRPARRPDGQGHQRRRHGHQRHRPHDDRRRARTAGAPHQHDRLPRADAGLPRQRHRHGPGRRRDPPLRRRDRSRGDAHQHRDLGLPAARQAARRRRRRPPGVGPVPARRRRRRPGGGAGRAHRRHAALPRPLGDRRRAGRAGWRSDGVAVLAGGLALHGPDGRLLPFDGP